MGTRHLTPVVRFITPEEFVPENPMQEKFYIDECTARSNEGGESKLLVQNSCVVDETDAVLDRVKPLLSDDGKKLQFKQFAFDGGKFFYCRENLFRT